jgi:hypothetical protein
VVFTGQHSRVQEKYRDLLVSDLHLGEMTSPASTLRLILALIVLDSVIYAAGSVRQSTAPLGSSSNFTVTFLWTGDETDGSVPPTAAALGSFRTRLQGYRILQVKTVPGSPAPTDGYGVALRDSDGGDIMNAALSELSATSVQFFAPSSATPPIDGTFILNISRQSVPGAQGKVVIYLSPGAGAVSSSGVNASAFDFTPQTPGGSLTSEAAATVTLTPCPKGVSGADVGHYLYISGGVGTAEDVLITGGSCTPGAATGTVTFRPANDHSGAWTISSGTAGIREAESAMPDGGLIQGPSGISTIGPLFLNRDGVMLHLQGELDLRNGATITMSGERVGIMGDGYRLIRALATSGDVIALVDCVHCMLQNLYLDRVANAVSGAGVDIASGHNTGFTASNLLIAHQYRGIYARVAPVLSNWVGITTLNNAAQGMEFVNANDEQVTNFWSERNGGHGIRVGPGNDCVGSMKFSNGTVYGNTGDGIHIEGASTAAPCTFVWLSSVIADTDGGYELYVKNAVATNVSGSVFNNAMGENSVRLDEGTIGFTASAIGASGANREGLYITHEARSIDIAGLGALNNGKESPGTYYAVNIGGGANNIAISGGLVGNDGTPNTLGGISIDSTDGAPWNIGITGVNFQGIATANYVTRSPDIPAGGAGGVAIDLNFKSSAMDSRGAQSIPDSIWTSVTFDSNSFDFGDIHSTDSDTSRFTVPAGGDGLYNVTCSESFEDNPTGLRYVRILKNASTVIGGSNANAVAGDVTLLQATADSQLTAGDFVECQVFQSSGGTLSMAGTASGTITKIR